MVLTAGGAVAGYVHYINGQLSSGLDKNLDDVLVPTEAGKPFYMLLLGIDKDEDRTGSSDYRTPPGSRPLTRCTRLWPTRSETVQASP